MYKNYLLRKWKLSDKKSLAENANNINIWNNVRDYFPYPYTVEDGEQFINMVLNKESPFADFAIDVDGKAVGGIGIVLNSDVERISAEVGYWLGECYWNRGIMTNVVREMVDKAKDDSKRFGFKKLYLSTVHVGYYEKFGFRYIGQGYHLWNEESRIYQIEL